MRAASLEDFLPDLLRPHSVWFQCRELRGHTMDPLACLGDRGFPFARGTDVVHVVRLGVRPDLVDLCQTEDPSRVLRQQVVVLATLG